MFASFFGKQKSASTSRSGSLWTKLGVESLEDRSVPSTLLSNLGAAADGIYVFGGRVGGVIGGDGQVSVFSSISPGDRSGEEIPTATGG